jgi:hypothetical protein
VAVIDRGRLISVLSVDLNSSALRVRVTVDSNQMAPARTALDGWTVIAVSPEQLVVAGGDGREVNRALGEAGIFASAVTPEHLSLEERFLAITHTEGERDAAAAS